MLQDAHLHPQDIDDPAEAGRLLAGAARRGIGRLIVNATSPEDWDKVVASAAANTSVVPFFGLHPWFVAQAKPGWDGALEQLLAAHRAGVGEIGLDGSRSRPDLEIQKAVFSRQLDIAFKLDRPAAIHCVHAWGELLDILRSRSPARGSFMIHLFSGSKEVLAELLKMGAYISFSLGIEDGASPKAREAYMLTPPAQLLLETDYPYIPGRRDAAGAPGADEYYARLNRLYDCAARIQGMDRATLETTVWDNGTTFLHGIDIG